MGGPHSGNRNRPAYSGQARFRFPAIVIKLFVPRKPIPFKPPPRKRRLRKISGLADFVSKFEDTTKPESKETAVSQAPFETPAQQQRRVREEKLSNVQLIVAESREKWSPFEKVDGKEKTKDAFRTLFVSNIPYQMLDIRLHNEFEAFGPVRQVIAPKDKDGFPRGYAFIEYERERDLKIAYREANGMRMDGRRLLVDVERGRTVEDWLPNRLDGQHNSCARRATSAQKKSKPDSK